MNKPLTPVFLAFAAACCCAQSGKIDPAARKGIDAGNQAWVAAMKQSEAALVLATYADDAVDCSAAGDCLRGRAAIQAYFQERMAKFGRARSASVSSAGSVQQGDFVYEWGRAEAVSESGQRISGRYLTAWRKQPDGSWKIFRNMPIPDDRSN